MSIDQRIIAKKPSEQLIPLGTLVTYTGGLKAAPIFDSSMNTLVGNIRIDGLAIIIGQSYDDRYIQVLTSEGIKGWVLCHMLTLVK